MDSHEFLLRSGYFSRMTQESRRHFICIYQFPIKDTNDWPGEELHKARSRWVPSMGVSVPMELEHISLLVVDVFVSSETPKSHCLEVFMKVSLGRQD